MDRRRRGEHPVLAGDPLAPALIAITVVDVPGDVPITPGLPVGTIAPPVVAAAFAAWDLLAPSERDPARRP